MGADDLFQLLVALAIIIFGLLGGGRKKKRPPSTSPGRSQAPSAGRPAPIPERQAPTAGRDQLFTEIERILRGQVPEPRPVPPSRASEPEEAYSLEDLDAESVEIDEQQRHHQFHDKYVTPHVVGPLPPATVAARPVARVRRIPLRQAVIWREILGPPKGLQ